MKAFAEISWLDFPQTYYQTIKQEILNQGKDYILKVDEDEYIKYLIEKYKIEPLTILQDTEIVHEPIKSRVQRNDGFGRGYHCDAYSFVITYSFTGHPGLFRVQPNPYIWATYEINVNASNKTVSFNFTIFRQDPNDFKQMKSQCYSEAFTNMSGINENLKGMMANFDYTVRSLFLDEKNKYKTENAFYEAVNIKVNPNTTSVFSAPTIRKKIIPQPVVSKNKEFNSVPSMSQEMYEDVLKVLYDSGKSMEKKPALYLNKDEEGLRDQFLFVLETRYVGTTATGETFNRSGKTDILLKYADDGSNLFVAECKIWHGPSELLKAISQLFDKYLTWRDSKVAIIIFVQNNDFSNVLESIINETPKHTYFKSFKGKRGETSFSYVFHLPIDTKKEVQLEIIAFHYDKK